MFNTPAAGSEAKNFRLPKNVSPNRYLITLIPDLGNYTFTGHETVEVSVNEPTNAILINAKDMAISEASVTDATGTTLNGTIALDTETEIATISFNGKLGAGNWKLFLKFSGTLRDDLKGFYRSVHPNGSTIATTQFETTDARSCFPCFDEPEFKATYKVTLVVDEHLTALSNGSVESVKPYDDGMRFCQATNRKAKKAVTFTETMKMSTYLVCCIAGEFSALEPIHVNGKALRVWAPTGQEHLTTFARKVAAFGVKWYEDYFRVPYPGGNKIDFVAIPDFAAGAMENLGCITFRMTDCLIDEATATHGEMERVAEVVLHELAHMWFGDLVTMKWWVSLWLNESFATFMEKKSLSEWKPDWKIWDGFGLSRAAALRTDSLKSTHPIECPVNRPEETEELFDVISYEKGCSVLYMIEQFIGPEVFRDGITDYLRTHSFGNAETSDLWDALEGACQKHGLDIPVRKIMDAWVLTAGHPVVIVGNGTTPGAIALSQQEFKFLGEHADASKRFPIPVIMRAKTAAGVVEVKHLLDGDKAEVYIGEGLEWVVVNADGSGLYRVRYAPELMAKLIGNVQGTLSVIERFNLVNDTWSCVRAGLTSTPEYLAMVKLFADETDPNVWSIVRGSIATMFDLLPEEDKAVASEMIRCLLRPQFDRLGWTPAAGESVQTKELRGSMISTLGTIGGDTEVRAKVKELFASWKKDRTSVDSNIVPAMVGVLAYNGDTALYNEFVTLWKGAPTPQEGERFLFALTGFRDKALLKRTIDLSLSNEVKNQDAPDLLASCVGHDADFRMAWDFMVANWAKIVEAYPQSGTVRLCRSVTSLDTPELETEVQAFFAKTKVDAGTMAIAQALESLRINVSLRQRESEKLSDHINPTPAPAPSAPSDKADGTAQ